MAEQVTILNDDAVILHPDPDARCPMAQMVTPDNIDKTRKMYLKASVITYVNIVLLWSRLKPTVLVQMLTL
uniref:Uncharacterized protein n=1 Tax=Ignisphaera aggregans TaxID=334771 RepID=A0A7J3MXG0_9CREN